MLNTELNTKSNIYLSNCDLINKYSLKSVYCAPKTSKIVLDFNLLDFLTAIDSNHNKEQTDSNLQIRAFTIFYILNEFMSYINFNKSLNSLKKMKISENNYSLKIAITDPKEINSFLFSFFIENWSKLILEDFVLFKNSKAVVNTLDQNFVFSTTVPASSFFALDSFLSKTNSGVNSKNFNIKINFVFKNTIKLENSKKTIKNLPYFWISG